MIHISSSTDLPPAFRLVRVRRIPTEQHARQMPEAFAVETQHGTMVGRAGDWLMEGVTGQLYIVGKDEFTRSYEETK